MGNPTSKYYFYNYNITKKEFCKFSLENLSEQENEGKKQINKENKKLFSLTQWDPLDLIVQVMTSQHNIIYIQETQKYHNYPIFLNRNDAHNTLEGPYITYNPNPVELIDDYDGTDTINSISLYNKETEQFLTYADSEFIPATKTVLLLHHNLSKLQFTTTILTFPHNNFPTPEQIFASQNIDDVLLQGEWVKKTGTKRKASSTTSTPPTTPTSTPIPTLQNNIIIQTLIDYSSIKIKKHRQFDLSTKTEVIPPVCKILHKFLKPTSQMLPTVLNKAYTIETTTKKFKPEDFQENDAPMLDTFIVTDKHDTQTIYKHQDFKLVKNIQSNYNNFI